MGMENVCVCVKKIFFVHLIGNTHMPACRKSRSSPRRSPRRLKSRSKSWSKSPRRSPKRRSSGRARRAAVRRSHTTGLVDDLTPTSKYRSSVFDVCTFDHAIIVTEALLLTCEDDALIINYIKKRVQELLDTTTSVPNFVMKMFKNMAELATYAWIYRLFSELPNASAAFYYIAVLIMIETYVPEPRRKKIRTELMQSEQVVIQGIDMFLGPLTRILFPDVLSSYTLEHPINDAISNAQRAAIHDDAQREALHNLVPGHGGSLYDMKETWKLTTGNDWVDGSYPDVWQRLSDTEFTVSYPNDPEQLTRLWWHEYSVAVEVLEHDKIPETVMRTTRDEWSALLQNVPIEDIPATPGSYVHVLQRIHAEGTVNEEAVQTYLRFAGNVIREHQDTIIEPLAESIATESIIPDVFSGTLLMTFLKYAGTAARMVMFKISDVAGFIRLAMQDLRTGNISDPVLSLVSSALPLNHSIVRYAVEKSGHSRPKGRKKGAIGKIGSMACESFAFGFQDVYLEPTVKRRLIDHRVDGESNVLGEEDKRKIIHYGHFVTRYAQTYIA